MKMEVPQSSPYGSFNSTFMDDWMIPGGTTIDLGNPHGARSPPPIGCDALRKKQLLSSVLFR